MIDILRQFLFIATVGVVVVGAREAGAEPVFALADDVLMLKPEVAAGRDFLELEVRGVEPGSRVELQEVADLGVPVPPEVKIEFQPHALEQGEDAGTRRWVLNADISDLPSGTNQRRHLSFKYGDREFVLPYLLTTTPRAPFAWTVKGPSEVSLRPGEGIPLGFAVTGAPATNVGLFEASFIEQESKSNVHGDWQLCANAIGACDKNISSIPANSVTRLWLHPKAEKGVIGEYRGTITVSAAEKPDGNTVTLTIFGTSAWLRGAGVVVILASVGAAWAVSVLLRRRLNRLQLLLPVPRLSARVEDLRARMVEATEKIPEAGRSTTKALDALAKRLTIADLDSRGILPRGISSPLGSPEHDADNYADYLTALGKWITFFEIMVGDGFEELSELAHKNASDGVRTAIVAAVEDLDDLVPLYALSENTPQSPPEPAALRAQIDGIMQGLQGSLPQGVVARAASSAAPSPLTYERLDLDLNVTSGIMWFVFALLTTALGAYVLVFDNPGFGTWKDLLLCLFWGFGLPIGAEQLKQSTPDTVKKALGIPIPKLS